MSVTEDGRRRRVARRPAGRGRWWVLTAACVLAAATCSAARRRLPARPRVEVKNDEEAGLLDARIGGRTAFTFHYGPGVDLPHLVPRSPSGKALTVVRTKPYPHHRSLWFADTVQLAGKRKVSFYNAFYSRIDKKDPNSPFNDRIRVVEISPGHVRGRTDGIRMRLLWEMDRGTPVLDEERVVRVVVLGEGQYLLDMTFTLTARYGDVAFVSDAVHYAWPYVRMHPTFSVQQGGTMTSSAGGVNQKATHGKAARWIDYTNTVEGVTEGLALFTDPTAKQPPKWLTRDYGTFGPRRIDARSGKRFTLAKGESLSTRVGLFVHRGDVKAAKVAERYEQYAKTVRQP